MSTFASTSTPNSTAATLRICFDQVTADHICGRVVSQRFTAPLYFTDIATLLLQLEAVLNSQNFPQAFERTRSFSAAAPHKIPAAACLEDGMSAQAVAAAQGAVTTAVLAILSRRNTTWQGNIDWLDGTPPQEFSSALTLLKFMDQHLAPS